MARYTESFVVARPLDVVATACRQAFAGNRWQLRDDRGWAFLVREGMDLLTVFFRYRTDFAVFLRDGKGNEAPADGPVTVELHGKIFGIGPIPNGNLRKRARMLRGQIEQCVAAMGEDAIADEGDTAGNSSGSS